MDKQAKKYLLNFYLLIFLAKTIRNIGVTEISKVSTPTLNNLFVIYTAPFSTFYTLYFNYSSILLFSSTISEISFNLFSNNFLTIYFNLYSGTSGVGDIFLLIEYYTTSSSLLAHRITPTSLY